jgi:hypothetical protein
MSFSSNIFTNLPLVHTLNPDFLDNNFDFASPQVHECLHAQLPNWVLDRFPNWPSLFQRFVDVFARDFRTGFSTDSRIGRTPKFASPPARGSEPPHVRDPNTSPNQDSRTSHIREFEASQAPGFRKSWVPCPWKTCLKNFVKLNVSRVTGFPEFPNNHVEKLKWQTW